MSIKWAPEVYHARGIEMTESEYQQLADAAFQRLEAALDGCDEAIDYEHAAGGVLELEFADGSKIVVNRQAAVQEIWVAARSGGFHFRFDEGAWRDTRSGEELFAALARLATDQAGETILLA
jgi:CyaY protein